MNEKTTFDEKRFCTHLKSQAALIKVSSMDLKQILRLFTSMKDSLSFANKSTRTNTDANDWQEAIFEFSVACEIAFSNYRRENKNMWTNIFGFGASKIPKLEMPFMKKNE